MTEEKEFCSHEFENVRYLGVGYTTGDDYYKCEKCGYIFKAKWR